MSDETQLPWAISEARTVDGHLMIVGGEGQGFGLIAEVTLENDAYIIVNAVNSHEHMAQRISALVAERDALVKRCKEQGQEIAITRERDEALVAAVEACVETLEAMDLHIDNPLYERMRTALEAALSPEHQREEAK